MGAGAGGFRYDGRVRVIDPGQDDSLRAVMDLVRLLTADEDAERSLATFTRLYSAIRPVDYYVGAAPEEGGGYRVLYELGPGEPARLDGGAGVRRGGVLGALMAGAMPKVALDLSITQDPALGDRVRAMRSVVAVPVFHGNQVVEWNFGFSARGEGVSPSQLGQALLTSNLLGSGRRAVGTLARVRELNGALVEELETIARIQRALLPEALPDVLGLELAADYATSQQAGGDYYDIFPFADGRWGLLVADVSGHGAAAATVVAMLHAIVGSYLSLAHGAADPCGLLGFVNDRLVGSGIDGSFVTAFLAVYDPARGGIDYASAGHPAPRLVHATSGEVVALDRSLSIPLGILPGWSGRPAWMAMGPGDELVLFTDGVSELFGPGRQLFGTDRLERVLRRRSASPAGTIAGVREALRTFRGDDGRDDDQTLLVARRTGGAA